MDKRILSNMTDRLAIGYIDLKNIESEIYTDKNLANTLILGKAVLQVARRIQEEFFPMNDSSEEIIMTLLNQKFTYDGVDYSDEVDDKLLLSCCDEGLFLYTINALSDEINIINQLISDLQGEEESL